MLIADNTITLEIPSPIALTNREADAIMFQLNGLLYTGYCDLSPKVDPLYPGKLWYRIEQCRCHGLVEDTESMFMAVARLQMLANTLEF